MKTWICTTLVNFLTPMQGAARLYAYLKKQGHDVSLKDMNQDIYFKLLSKDYLEETFDRTKRMISPITRDKFLRENIGSIILNNSHNNLRSMAVQSILQKKQVEHPFASIKPFENIFSKVIGSKIDQSNILYALLDNQNFILDKVERSRLALDEQFLSLPPDEFLSHFKTLLNGKALIDAAYFPSQLDFGLGFQGAAYRPHSADIMASVKDKRYNFLIPYYEKEIVPQLNKEKPDIVGISITHTSEFVPAFTLASIIKSVDPKIHICLGGATVSEISTRLQKNISLWDLFDSLIIGAGEEAFSQLIEAIENKKSLSTVPNLIYKDSGTIKSSEVIKEFDINNACTPDFGELRPKSILPLETSSGCYWGKCIFCYYPKQGLVDKKCDENTRIRDIDLVLEDIRKLRDIYDPSYIVITDSSLSTERMEKIVDQNLKSDKFVPFSAFIRFEKEFKDLSLCKKMSQGGFLGGQAGLESGAQRVNDIINKGVDLEDVKVILKNFSKAGILLHVYTIVGIPGETRKEAFLTFEFLKKYQKLLPLNWQIYPFRVLEYGPLVQRAEEFGLTVEKLPDEYLVQLTAHKFKDGLSAKDSLGLSISFNEKLKPYMNPLTEIMDLETSKVMLLLRQSLRFQKNKLFSK